MNRDQEPNIGQLASAVREVYRRSPQDAEAAIEELLQRQLDGLPLEDRLRVIGRLERHLMEPHQGSPAAGDEQVLERVCTLLLGRQVDSSRMDPGQLSRRLAQALNTVFDALNRVIGVINKTLAAGKNQADQTIRQVIGRQIEEDGPGCSLQEHLDQIADAFLKVHTAFKAAAESKVGQILDALDPETLAAERSGGIKIGPLRKAEDYEILVEKIARIRKWYDSGKFMEEFLREFERNCQQDSKT